MYTVELDFCGDADDPATTTDEGMVLEWVRLTLGVREDITFAVQSFPNDFPRVTFTAPTRDAIEDVVRAYAPLDDDVADCGDPYDQEYLLTTITEVAA